jgi:hypothetical protein
MTPGLVDATAPVFSLVIEGDATASELVKQGSYGWADGWITDEHFPIEKHASVERTIELVGFDHDATSGEALEEFERRGLEQPTYEDALYFGIQHPEAQSQRPIVFLHEPVRDRVGSADILVLDEVRGVRGLYLLWFRRSWEQNYLFAGVRR